MSSNTEFDNISFDLPKNQSNVIKVIGVGGGGSNAINHMFSQGIKGVDFVICNTDAQALENSSVPIKIQLGMDLTEGLGAGANPKIGEQSAVESMADIKSMLTSNTKMIFITAGMGGGTGTGAAPIIARMAKDMDILTVGIVTIPFQFEGKVRNEQAHIGVENLRQNVDSLVVINNNKLREVYGNLGFKAGFSKADEVLATAARGIAEVITHHYTQNIDLRDAKTVLSNSGTAIMGSATATGTNRAYEAISKALDSPLLNDNKITGAKNVLLLIVSGADEITIDEIGEISDHIQVEAGHSANIIMGVGDDESLEGSISITIIATGFDAEQQHDITNTETKKIIHTLGDEHKAELDLTPKVTAKQIELTSDDVTQEVNQEAPVIRHTLFEEEEVETKPIQVEESRVEQPKPQSFFPEKTASLENNDPANDLPFEGYIATSELIKNIGVEATTIDIHHLAEFEQIIINEIDVNSFELVPQRNSRNKIEEVTKPEQFIIKDTTKVKEETKESDGMLHFDMPFSESSIKGSGAREPIARHLVDDIEVKDPLEVVPVNEVTRAGVKVYSLDDYSEVEEELITAKPAQNKEIAEETIIFETKTIPSKEEDVIPEDAPIDPMNTPISKLLKDRTEERKRKMKDFNYKFRNSASKIDEIERQPAYKRQGIELEDTNESNPNLSRTSVNTDDDDIDLRSNNSFLHDNVD
ncbi:cell division protein FtsZ [Patiriisocius sp. Uisw_017]|uniref:cell division protein FtsZ n=1 Tax=Patiriisocius sp. Uisw_017 TaxID=3230968 RepID=UPI0039E80B47